MQNRLWQLLAILALALMTVGCNRQVVYAHYEHVEDTGWEKCDTLHFDIPPIAKGGTYAEKAALRIDKEFPFQSLTLRIIQTVYPEGRQENYTLNCSLIDPKGNVKGDGISYFQYSFHLDDIVLQQGDSLHLSIVHNMKRETMPGVTDVGIRLTRKKQGQEPSSTTHQVTTSIDAQEDEQQQRESPE